MPKGELFIKTPKTSGYVDAYDNYGLSLEDISPLIVPAPNKQPTGNSNALTSGVAYLGGSVSVKDERTLSLECHIYAIDKVQFFQRLAKFSDEVLDLSPGQHILLYTSYVPYAHHLVYQNFQQFAAFNMEMAKFIWTLLEPHPELLESVTQSSSPTPTITPDPNT